MSSPNNLNSECSSPSSIESSSTSTAKRRSLVTRTHSPKTTEEREKKLSSSSLWSLTNKIPLPRSLLTANANASTPSRSSSTDTSSSIPPPPIALLLPPTLEGVQEAAIRLQNGQLLAFPTETVYGLGANALIEESVLSIFKCKGRPLTDPLIVHVHNVDAALKCLTFPGPIFSPSPHTEGRLIFDRLSESFWPGALTIVAKSSPQIPLMVTANTGFVGIRIPSHPLALRILEACNVPVAAPSANRFGHVSPTLASHVMADLGHTDIAIMNGEDKREIFAVPACEFGIESTVVKINDSTRELIVLRRGAISAKQLRSCFEREMTSPMGKIIQSKSSSSWDVGGDVLPSILSKWSVVEVTQHYDRSLEEARRLADPGSEVKEGEMMEKEGDIGLGLTSSNVESPQKIKVTVKVNENGKRGAANGNGNMKTRGNPSPSPSSEKPSKKARANSSGKSVFPSTPHENKNIDNDNDSDNSNIRAIDGQGHAAPGQELTHYAPDGLECYLVRPKGALLNSSSLDDVNKVVKMTVANACEGGVVVIDFNNQMGKRGLRLGTAGVVAYKDLSTKGCIKEATKNLFATLRWSEDYSSKAKRVVIADLAVLMSGDEFVGGIGDRMFRSASGKVMELK